MKILIIYATNSGSTFLTARQIGLLLEKKHTVTLKKAAEVHPHELTLYPLVLIGSPSWDYEGKEGQPHESIIHLLAAIHDVDLSHTQFALFGCGDAAYTYFCGAVDMMSAWLQEHHAEEITLPLKIDGYYFTLPQSTAMIETWTKNLLKHTS